MRSGRSGRSSTTRARARRAATRANATMESYRKAFIQTGKFAPMKHFMVRGDGRGAAMARARVRGLRADA